MLFKKHCLKIFYFNFHIVNVFFIFIFSFNINIINPKFSLKYLYALSKLYGMYFIIYSIITKKKESRITKQWKTFNRQVYRQGFFCVFENLC